MAGVLLGVLLISALLIVVKGAVSFGIVLLDGGIPTHGPIRYAAHAQIARRESADLDREYERLLSD